MAHDHQDSGTMSSGAGPPRVLFVGGDSAVRAEFERLSAEAGWVCETLDGTASMLQVVGARRFDIIVSDLLIPEMTQQELLARLSAPLAGGLAPRVIVVDSSGAWANPTELIRAGAFDVLPPESDLVAIGRSIDRLVRRGADGESAPWGYRFLHSERGRWVLRAADLAALGRFPLYSAERLDRVGRIDGDVKRRLDLAFHEALNNALEHGCLELDSAWREEIDEHGVDRYTRARATRLTDPHYAERRITIETVLEGPKFTITISDQGKGFDPAKQKAAVGSSLCSGRGLAIIQWSVDEVRFSTDGTEITLVKYLSN